MPDKRLNQFRMLALEAWSAAARMTDPACRTTMEELAVRYDRLADHLEQRSADPKRRFASHRDV